MKILVLNCGSSSIKYQLIDMPAKKLLAKGLVERIGESQGLLKHVTDKGKQSFNEVFDNHDVGLQRVIDLLTDNDPLNDISEIDLAAHRVVHGGESLTQTVRIDENVINKIIEIEPLDPLHAGAHVLGMRVVQRLLPKLTQYAVFDTAFHQTMPRKAYLYALPYELYKKHSIRRYGFHGTSHQYVSHRLAEILQRDISTLNIITCHIGNGASVAAIKGGKCIDTSMGLTPLEGLVMGTRCGDLDPAILTFLGTNHDYSPQALDDLMNKKSGLLGLSEMSNDCRVVEEAAMAGDDNALRAMEVYCYRIRKYIGAYAAALGSVDAVIFTAGAGENSPYVRKMTCENLDVLGIKIDTAANDVYGKEQLVSTRDSKTQVWVVPTNEELAIATQSYELHKREA